MQGARTVLPAAGLAQPARCSPPGARAVRWIERMVDEHPDQAIAAVTHGDVIKALLCHALGLSLDFTQRFEVGPASVSVIAAGDWGLKVHSINEACR